jgi:hypothetical protein
MIPGRTQSQWVSDSRPLKGSPLLGDALVVIGAREMRHERECTRLRTGAQNVENARHLLGAQSQTIHSRIQLDENVHAHTRRQVAQHRQLFRIVHCTREPVARGHGQFTRVECAFEQKDRLGVALLPQLHRIIDFQNRETVGSRQRPRGAREPVSVGMRFHYSKYARVRCGAAHHA